MTREERLKAALRANLMKRKMRERGAAEPGVAAAPDALYPPDGGREDKTCERDT